MENTNAVTTVNQENNIMLANELGTYCSFKPTSDSDKVMLFNAMNNPTHRLADMINMEINVKHIFAEIVEIEPDSEQFRQINAETGEIIKNKCPRIVLIDDKGESYACVSVGIMSAIQKIIKIFGEPSTWKTPKKMKVKQITKKEKKMLTIELA